jgi:quaternary ammonium compound-resistance protein SugE
MSSAWIYLVIAGLLEVGWTIGLKYSQGFTKLIPSLLTSVALVLSMYLLAKSVQIIPIGTAYAIWVGIGVLGAAIFGYFLFQEPMPTLRIFFLVAILISIIGLKITSS